MATSSTLTADSTKGDSTCSNVLRLTIPSCITKSSIQKTYSCPSNYCKSLKLTVIQRILINMLVFFSNCSISYKCYVVESGDLLCRSTNWSNLLLSNNWLNHYEYNGWSLNHEVWTWCVPNHLESNKKEWIKEKKSVSKKTWLLTQLVPLCKSHGTSLGMWKDPENLWWWSKGTYVFMNLDIQSCNT